MKITKYAIGDWYYYFIRKDPRKNLYLKDKTWVTGYLNATRYKSYKEAKQAMKIDEHAIYDDNILYINDEYVFAICENRCIDLKNREFVALTDEIKRGTFRPVTDMEHRWWYICNQKNKVIEDYQEKSPDKILVYPHGSSSAVVFCGDKGVFFGSNHFTQPCLPKDFGRPATEEEKEIFYSVKCHIGDQVLWRGRQCLISGAWRDCYKLQSINKKTTAYVVKRKKLDNYKEGPLRKAFYYLFRI